MNILVCVKRVPAPGARILLTEDGMSIDARHLGFTTSPHEECAVEAAVQLKEKHGGSTTVLTLGPPEAVEQLRYSVSVGADQAVLVPADTTEVDPQATASALVEAIRRLRANRRSIWSCSATSPPTRVDIRWESGWRGLWIVPSSAV